jgi:hypothetical protein
MLEFNIPEKFNGAEFRLELADAGVSLYEETELINIIEIKNDKLVVNVDESYETLVAAVVAAHNGTTVAPEPTIADKLASVGLSLDELKAAILGGN